MRGYLNDADQRLGVLIQHGPEGRRGQMQYDGGGRGSHHHHLKGSTVTLAEGGRSPFVTI